MAYKLLSQQPYNMGTFLCGFVAKWEGVPPENGEDVESPISPPMEDFQVTLWKNGLIDFEYMSVLNFNRTFGAVVQSYTDEPHLEISGDILQQQFEAPGRTVVRIFPELEQDLSNLQTAVHRDDNDGHPACPEDIAEIQQTVELSTSSEVEALCGVLMVSENGHYMNSMDAGSRISYEGCESFSLSFVEMDTEQGYDMVSIYDGPDAFSPLLIRVSGGLNEVRAILSGGLTVESNNMQVYVRFQSDETFARNGFKLRFACLN